MPPVPRLRPEVGRGGLRPPALVFLFFCPFLFLFLVAFLFLVVRPGAPSSVLVPSSKARSP